MNMIVSMFMSVVATEVCIIFGRAQLRAFLIWKGINIVLTIHTFPNKEGSAIKDSVLVHEHRNVHEYGIG